MAREGEIVIEVEEEAEEEEKEEEEECANIVRIIGDEKESWLDEVVGEDEEEEPR